MRVAPSSERCSRCAKRPMRKPRARFSSESTCEAQPTWLRKCVREALLAIDGACASPHGGIWGGGQSLIVARGTWGGTRGIDAGVRSTHLPAGRNCEKNNGKQTSKDSKGLRLGIKYLQDMASSLQVSLGLSVDAPLRRDTVSIVVAQRSKTRSTLRRPARNDSRCRALPLRAQDSWSDWRPGRGI